MRPKAPLLDDLRVLHDVTPIAPIEYGRKARRDVLALTYRRAARKPTDARALRYEDMAPSIAARNIRLKRAYAAPSRDDGARVLVELVRVSGGDVCGPPDGAGRESAPPLRHP